MAYVEDFLEMTQELPRDTIRLSKMIREIDEKVFNSQKTLSELRKKYIYLCKSKNRNEKNEQEIIKQIEKEYYYILSLSDHKIEIVNEEEYITGYHLKKLIEIIENYEKSVHSLNLQHGLIPINYADFTGKTNDKSMSVMGDEMSLAGSKKRDIYSTKTGKETTQQFLKKKKNRPSSKLTKKEEVEELPQNLVESTYVDYDKQETEVYCVCSGPSYGDMIKCDNDSCEKEWFHYSCVNINSTPKGKWFCSPECAIKVKKRKR